MRYFKRIETGIATEPMLAEIYEKYGAWAATNGRKSQITTKKEALSVALRGIRKSQMFGRPRSDVHESRWTSRAASFPSAKSFLQETADRLACDLGRTRIAYLPAGQHVYPHVDRGEYYRVRGRFHIILESSIRLYIDASDENVHMQKGELWWFDNKQVHEAHNDGTEDCVYMTFDLLPYAMRAEAESATKSARESYNVIQP